MGLIEPFHRVAGLTLTDFSGRADDDRRSEQEKIFLYVPYTLLK